jgi:hypothetical protein
MAMVPSFNQFGCGHDNASTSNLKVWKSLAKRKEKETENKQRREVKKEKKKKKKDYLLYMIILVECSDTL